VKRRLSPLITTDAAGEDVARGAMFRDGSRSGVMTKVECQPVSGAGRMRRWLMAQAMPDRLRQPVLPGPRHPPCRKCPPAQPTAVTEVIRRYH
jgi:hypothetical protein